MSKKSIFDYKNISSVLAWCLLKCCSPAGMVYAYRTKNKISVAVDLFCPPRPYYKTHNPVEPGSSSNFSTAFKICMSKNYSGLESIDYAMMLDGKDNCKLWLRLRGYTIIEVLDNDSVL